VTVTLTTWGTGVLTDTFTAGAADIDPVTSNNSVTRSLAIG
jgi:hypothetical protein